MSKRSNSKKTKNQKAKSKPNAKKAQLNLIQKVKDFWNERSLVLKFVAIFTLVLGLFYVFYLSAFYKTSINPLVVNNQAGIGAMLINLFGAGVSTEGSSISNQDFSIDIAGGCDGIEVTAMLIAAILAFPALWKSRFKGILIGGLVIAVLNILRIPALFYAGANGNMGLFDFLHLQGGFIVFVSITIIIWGIWANWSLKRDAVL